MERSQQRKKLQEGNFFGCRDKFDSVGTKDLLAVLYFELFVGKTGIYPLLLLDESRAEYSYSSGRLL